MGSTIDDREWQQAIETRFECTRCGHCCKGDGVVRFSSAEADRMAGKLGLTRQAFLKTYAWRLEPGQWVLQDKFIMTAPTPGQAEQWCIFLEQDSDGFYQCAVNEAKPDQCRSFPARWRNLDSVQTCVGLRTLARSMRRP